MRKCPASFLELPPWQTPTCEFPPTVAIIVCSHDCSIHQTSQQGLSQVGVAPRSPLLFKRSKSSRTALIGGVVGGILGGLLLIALGICIFYKKIRRTERTHRNETAPVMPFGVTEPFTSPPQTASPLLALPVGPQTAVTPSSGTSYHDGPMTGSPALHGSTFAAQQNASMQQVRDAKGRQLFTAVSRPTLDSIESPPPTTASVADTQGSRRPMLPPAYD